jgi:hypothetical protein
VVARIGIGQDRVARIKFPALSAILADGQALLLPDERLADGQLKLVLSEHGD